MDVVTLGILAFLLMGAGAKSTAKSLEFIPTSLKVSKPKFGKFKGILSIDILNPRKGVLRIDSVILSIFANDKKIGRIEKTKPFKIAGHGRTSITLPVSLNALATGQTIASWIKKEPIEFKVLGVVNAMGIDTPVDEKIDFEL